MGKYSAYTIRRKQRSTYKYLQCATFVQGKERGYKKLYMSLTICAKINTGRLN